MGVECEDQYHGPWFHYHHSTVFYGPKRAIVLLKTLPNQLRTLRNGQKTDIPSRNDLWVEIEIQRYQMVMIGSVCRFPQLVELLYHETCLH